jgi:hypothetical protein
VTTFHVRTRPPDGRARQGPSKRETPLDRRANEKRLWIAAIVAVLPWLLVILELLKS